MERVVHTIRTARSVLELLTAIGVIAAFLAVVVSPVEGSKGLFLLAVTAVIATALCSVALSVVLDVIAAKEPSSKPNPSKAR